ncbi:MAG: PAS domain-containing protein [Alphaproteobacteria bacterium]|nr:PAS domain-containing protein [Alphaproteobacteria bacterium]
MAPTNRKLVTLQALWEEKRRGRTMPSRSDISVFVLRPWLGNLALIDLPAKGEGQFRLCGINLFSRFGGDVTGRVLADLGDEIGASLRELVAIVQTTNAPLEGQHSHIIEGQRVKFEELLLPMSDHGYQANVLLFACYRSQLESLW